MSAKETKVFGMRLGVDPKIIVLVLVVLAGLLYYFTSDSTAPGSRTAASTAANTAGRPGGLTPLSSRVVRRANVSRNERDALKLVAVDGSHGDIDPTLRLGLLDRVKNIPPAAGLRNLFEAGGVAQALPPVPEHPKMLPQPVVPVIADSGPPPPPPPPPFTIPLKYYGFVKPTGRSMEGNRGFFMDGENILIGGEGDILEKKFLIVALTPNSARLEDTQAKQGQELPVTPAAQPSQ